MQGDNWSLQELAREMLMLRINMLTVNAKLVPLGPTKNGLVLAFASASRTGFNVWVSTVCIDILMNVTQPCGRGFCLCYYEVVFGSGRDGL